MKKKYSQQIASKFPKMFPKRFNKRAHENQSTNEQYLNNKDKIVDSFEENTQDFLKGPINLEVNQDY